MYRLIYKATTGSQGEKDVQEYSIWLEQEPTAQEKEDLISQLDAEGKLPERSIDESHAKQFENYSQTVMVNRGDNLEVVYQRKEAKEVTFYSNGTYTVDEGTSHNYNDSYFKFDGPYNRLEEAKDKDIQIAEIHAETAERVANIHAEANKQIARVNE